MPGPSRFWIEIILSQKIEVSPMLTSPAKAPAHVFPARTPEEAGKHNLELDFESAERVIWN
jgi:hypothetical protein